MFTKFLNYVSKKVNFQKFLKYTSKSFIPLAPALRLFRPAPA